MARLAPDPAAVPVFPSYDMERQFRVMRELGALGALPVPRVLWCETDPAPLGAPFFVMERVEGEVPPDILPYTFGQSWLSQGTPEQRARLQEGSVGLLAALFRMDRPTERFAFLASTRPGATPLARFVSFAVAGVPPEIMGIGPIAAIPKALRQAGITKDQLDWIELNEAFAAQALAVIRDVGLDAGKVNPLGGAIALGHPLGATGAIRAATIVHGLRRRQQKYGMVTMCIGTGMGAAGIFESL